MIAGMQVQNKRPNPSGNRRFHVASNRRHDAAFFALRRIPSTPITRKPWTLAADLAAASSRINLKTAVDSFVGAEK
jgi:alkanesulfonate monooxygenase SsuD/methylene tetrahydromethanopterin reductase-like flavin-dependent oxidoreductase (luciferase family)